MDTRERLREQRKANMAIGWPMGVGLILGLAIGYLPRIAEGAETAFVQYAYFLIAFGLGAVCALTGVWLTGRRVRKQGNATEVG